MGFETDEAHSIDNLAGERRAFRQPSVAVFKSLSLPQGQGSFRLTVSIHFHGTRMTKACGVPVILANDRRALGASAHAARPYSHTALVGGVSSQGLSTGARAF